MTNKESTMSGVVELELAELADVTGGGFVNIYSKDGFYSGSNVNSFSRRKFKKKR